MEQESRKIEETAYTVLHQQWLELELLYKQLKQSPSSENALALLCHKQRLLIGQIMNFTQFSENNHKDLNELSAKIQLIKEARLAAQDIQDLSCPAAVQAYDSLLNQAVGALLALYPNANDQAYTIE